MVYTLSYIIVVVEKIMIPYANFIASPRKKRREFTSRLFIMLEDRPVGLLPSVYPMTFNVHERPHEHQKTQQTQKSAYSM